MKKFIRALSPQTEFIIVVGGAFGIFMLASLLAFLRPGGSGIPGSGRALWGLVIHECVVLVLLLAFLRVRGWSLRRVGLRIDLRGTLIGCGLVVVAYASYVAAYMAAAALARYVAPVVAHAVASGGAGPARIGLALAIAVSIVNPVFEELFVSGYVITALKERRGLWTAVAVSLAIRLSYHLDQGALDVIGLIPLGFVFAYWYARSGRLWPVIVAHAIFNFIGFAAGL